ncbi:AAA-domain-containing protein [Aspergillus steynii IBT 23096]|uniref:AAA-domain-containing protein n=1 Tax=Aspergillus steynii IBT 23096 TaxID=1392250 RepID=A0A2I2GS69_9EURO|nr:AAA-domain-containing protein [Aspergillus steynii IBT 23096]PLB55722.1 AAA-domain-containing protein [Aspergillus steynii IBT 23096]
MQPARLLSSSVRPCRFVAHRRYPAAVVASRRFHISRLLRSSTPAGSDPRAGRDSTSENVSGPASTVNPGQNVSEQRTATTTPVAPSAAEEQQSVKKESSPYGSAIRRALRNKKPAKEWTAPVATVPDWFYERNTVVNGDEERQVAAQAPQQVKIAPSLTEADRTQADAVAQGGGSGDDNGGPAPSSDGAPGNENRYALTEALWQELCASARAGLRLPPAKYAAEPSARKSHLVLQYPGHDGILFLDAVVKRLAQELGADLVTLNAQDIAQLCSEQDLESVGTTSPIRSLGYEVYRPAMSDAWQDVGEEGESDDADAMESAMPSRSYRPGLAGPKFITIESSRGGAGDIPLPMPMGLKSLVAAFNAPMDGSGGSASSQNGKDRAEDMRLRLINELLSSPTKPSRQADKATPEEEGESHAIKNENTAPTQTRDIIVQVQDYGEIQSTREGARFIQLLQKAIQDRRKAGSRVLFVGTASQDATPDSDASRLMQNAFDDQFSQMLVVTPAMGSDMAERTFTDDRKKRTLEINIRHLQDMFRTRLHETPSALKDDIFSDRAWPLDASLVKESGLEDRYWTYSQVHWATTLALGNLKPEESFGFDHIRQGIEMMQKTERIRGDWLQEKTPKAKHTETGNERERLINSLRKTCNTHEKKLLNGVVDAKSLRTTFEDVHVPPETIDALKTLTSLSLIRPEAFTYGVLATDKIPGLLLYGPPGTGKTLLAKAVARESGATVLEVSGSEVYDMYVGEGEKNVKAIFTLAKKLSPCVVFIDEADAIFCSRTGASSRTSHRELINQFLREWDGMNDLSAFIMVATNRPFDLDDAVLRRLPRRLLVDLPTEQDRHAILKIHLKEETLDGSVDLAELARRTPLYSGSDLKNLSVAAALACVREENALAAQHQGEEPYQYPERRTLTWTHFERGMEEISASISEDMSSLSAVRKFDEQYGDRKGRRKKSPGWGFMPAATEEPDTDAARVRT